MAVVDWIFLTVALLFSGLFLYHLRRFEVVSFQSER